MHGDRQMDGQTGKDAGTKGKREIENKRKDIKN